MSSSSLLKTCSVVLADCIFLEGKSYIALSSDIISLTNTKNPDIIKVYRINNVTKCDKIGRNELYSTYRFSVQKNNYVTIALANGKQTEIFDANIKKIQIKEECFRKNIIDMLHIENDYIMNQISMEVCRRNPISDDLYKGKRFPIFLLTSLG